jgi:hypothetical protein
MWQFPIAFLGFFSFVLVAIGGGHALHTWRGPLLASSRGDTSDHRATVATTINVGHEGGADEGFGVVSL